jgi:cell division protein FtsQ
VHARPLTYAIVVGALLALLAAGWMWFRDSSFVRVRELTITGVTASDGERVKAALESAAREMSTLHVREDALREATRDLDSVADLKVTTDFPHGMTIEVIERRAVAALKTPKTKARIPVTEDGRLMRGVTAERELPSLVLPRAATGNKITDRRALHALAVAGAAPGPLRRRADKLKLDRRGVVVTMRNGPELVFGNDEAVKRKWAAAARVLAEPSARGATYLDVRIPGRVAAGGLAPIEPTTADSNLQLEPENG